MRPIGRYFPKAILRSGRASRADACECLRTGTRRLLGVLEAASEETLRRPIGPGKWSITCGSFPSELLLGWRCSRAQLGAAGASA